MTSCQLRTKLRVQPRLRTRCPSQLPWRPGSHGKPQEPPCHHSRSCPRPYECQDAFPPALCLQAALRLLCVAASFPGASSCRSAAYCGLHKQLAFPPQCCLVQPVCSAPLKGLDLPSGMGLPARCALAFRQTSPASTVHASAVGDEGHTAAGGWKASSLKAASSLNIQLWSCHSGRSASPAPVAGFGFACDRSLQFQERHTNNPTEANPCSRTPGPRTLPPNPAPRPLSQAFPSQCCLVQPVCNAPLKSFDLPSGMGLPARCALAFRRTSPASTVHAAACAVGDEGHAAVGGWKASSLKAASSLNIQLWSCHSGRSASPAPVAGFGFACDRSLQFQGRHAHGPNEAKPCSRTPGPRTLPPRPPAATKDRHSGVGWQVVRAGCFDWGRGETTESDRDTGKGPCTKKRRCR